MLRFTVPYRLWLTSDNQRLVPDNHPDASILYAIAGDLLPLTVAFRLGVSSTHTFTGTAEDGRCDLCGVFESHAMHGTEEERLERKQRFPLETKVIFPDETKLSKRETKRRKRETFAPLSGTKPNDTETPVEAETHA